MSSTHLSASGLSAGLSQMRGVSTMPGEMQLTWLGVGLGLKFGFRFGFGFGFGFG